MIKKITQIGLFFFILSSFLHCAEDGQIDSQSIDADAKRRMKPKVNAGPDTSITLPTNTVQLDGSTSTATVGAIKSYFWSNISGPNAPTIKNPSNAITDVTDLIEGVYTFRLEVTNEKNISASDDVLVTVNKSVELIATTLPTTEELYFSGNMDNVSITTVNNKLFFNGWDQLKNHQYISGFAIDNIGAVPYAYQEIRKDPTNSNKNVLYATTVDDDPVKSGTTRAQMTLHFKDGVDLQVYHTSHRMYLNPDIGYLSNYSPNMTWFTLLEIWNKRVATWDGDVAGSARWGLAINKDTGSGQPLYWRLKGDYMQPLAVRDKDMWVYKNRTIPIPLGKWFTLDVYLKRGEGTSGRMIVKITPDGEPTITLFDVANSTIYPGHPEIQLKAWQPFKLYLNDVYLDWMRENNKSISAYYNDFKWYKN